MIKSVSVRQVVKFTGKTRHCTIPVLSYEMAVLFMFHFIKIKLQVHFRVTISGYLTLVRRCHEYNFAYSIGKLRFPSESIGVYWKCRAKSAHLPLFFFLVLRSKKNKTEN